MTETGVLICGHGSRDAEAVREFELLAKALRPRFPDYDFATGYLEFATPDDPRRACDAGGARRQAHLRGTGDAVRRQPRQERPAVGDEQLYRRQSRHR